MKSQRSLVNIVLNNKLCIRDNPMGIKRLWPYSYIEHFYDQFCNELFYRNKSPNILEINQTNILNIKLWEFYFENPRVDKYNLEKIMSKNFKNLSKYDLIIIKDKNLITNKKVLSKLISSLAIDGIIVVENIGRKSKEVMQSTCERVH